MPKGSCLCGAVRFEAVGELASPTACHCSQCRRQSGHYWSSTDVPRAALRLQGEASLRWYKASEKVRRGFCGTCGSFLFWDAEGHASIAVAMGAFDLPTGTHLVRHIYVADKGDYYDIADGLPQNPQ